MQSISAFLDKTKISDIHEKILMPAVVSRDLYIFFGSSSTKV